MIKKLSDACRVTTLQKISLNIILILIILTFFLTGLQTKLWQSSQFLLSSVLPAVVVDLTNKERQSNDVPVLSRNKLLDQAAQLKAEDMARNSYFAHNSPDGKTPWYWLDKVGYKYIYAGENLAIHFKDSSELVKSWIESPLHHKNLVNDKYTEIGIGVADGYFEGNKTVYVVQLFGTPQEKAGNNKVKNTNSSVAVSIEKEKLKKISLTKKSKQSSTKKTDLKISKINKVVKTKTDKDSSVIITKQPDKREFLGTNDDIKTESEVSLETNKVITPEQVLVVDDLSLVNSTVVQTVNDKENVDKTKNKKMSESDILETDNVLSVEEDNLVYIYDRFTPEFVDGTEYGYKSYIYIPEKFYLFTQPSKLIQLIYKFLFSITIILLLISLVMEIYRKHLIHIAYSFGLLLLMVGLWNLHIWLISGAVIL